MLVVSTAILRFGFCLIYFDLFIADFFLQQINDQQDGYFLIEIFFLFSIIPTILNVFKNLFFNKKFKSEFFKRHDHHENRQNLLLETIGQELSRNFFVSFKRVNNKTKARKENMASVTIKDSPEDGVVEITLETKNS